MEMWINARHRATFLRTYVFPTLGRIAAAVMGVGLGYLIAHM